MSDQRESLRHDLSADERQSLFVQNEGLVESPWMRLYVTLALTVHPTTAKHDRGYHWSLPQTQAQRPKDYSSELREMNQAQ